ncbi:hypothetical protein BGX23_003867 [Mortierella sp. AD031]|nr:hypothetical protein BGX23_003867 [Mortierella sp. AD031]KAG0196107.1 hypothetical protein BGX33_002083 [Mortierella sp. NVP41]
MGGFGRHVSLAFPALCQNTTLRVLALEHNRFGEEGLSEFCRALRSNKRLGVLTCDGNDIYTPQGLNEIEKIFTPVSPLSLLPAASPIGHHSSEMTMEIDSSQGPDEQHHEYNRTLCVWKHGQDEFLMHMQLLTQEITRLVGERDRVEKLMATSQDLAHESDVKVMGRDLEDLKRRVAAAEKSRIEYSETHARIAKAIWDNNERLKRL